MIQPQSSTSQSSTLQSGTSQSSTREPLLRVSRIVFRGSHMVCSVQLSPLCPRESSARFIHELLKTHPQLPFHACKNEQGTTFASVMNATSLIHVFEHVIIDCMVKEEIQNNACSNALFRGNSQWDNRQQGSGHVELSFHDDLAALRALKQASIHVNQALSLLLPTSGRGPVAAISECKSD